MDALAHRVARRFVAAMFNVGDPVLYGKYKNKKGIIVKFVKDKKGYPAVEVEQLPNPTGRKENKVLTLFKIRKSPKPFGKKKKAMDHLTGKVAHTFKIRGDSRSTHMKKEAYLQIGKTIENHMVRMHRYRHHILITDLTNAGKRGKKVKILNVSRNSDPDNTMRPDLNGVAGLIEDYQGFNEVVAGLKDFLHDYPDALDMDYGSERGVDVTPAGFEEVEFSGKHVWVSVGYKYFTVSDLDDQNNLPRCIPSAKGGKKSIPIFYRWVSDNRAKIKSMTFSEVTKAMNDLGIRYHQYCAMD